MANTKVTGDLIASGTITADNLVSGTLDTLLNSYLTTNTYATQGYVTTAVNNLIDAAPASLDTLNELAAALNDDANFATTVTNSLATKLNLSGGTLTGALSAPDFYATYGTGGYVSMRAGGASAAGYLEVFKPGAVRLGYIGYDTTNILYQSENNANHVFQGGNVGINTTSPVATLDVRGGINVGGSGQNANIWFQQNTNNQARINYYTDGNFYFDNHSGAYNFRTTSSFTSRLFIENGGNVGIGTISPSNKLHVYGNGIVSRTTGVGDVNLRLQRFNSSGRTQYTFEDENGSQLWRCGLTGPGSTDYTFFDGTQNAVILKRNSDILLTPNGNVGIGTTSPQAKLHVEGDISQTSNSKTIVFSKTLSDNVGTDIAGFTGYTGDPSAATILVTVVVNASSGYAVETHRYLWNLRKATAGRSRSVTTLTGADQGSVNSGVVSIVSVTPVALYNSYERFRLSVNLSGISTCVVYVKMEALGENIRGLNPM